MCVCVCVCVRQDECVRQASRCVRLARLVVLQLHLLSQGSDQRLINLQPAETGPAMLALPRCYQVLCVCVCVCVC